MCVTSYMVINCLPCRSTVNDIFSVEYRRDLEMWVMGRSRSLEMATFDRSHRSFYSSSIVTMAVPFTVFEKNANFSYLHSL